MGTSGSGSTYVPPTVATNVHASTGGGLASATTINFTGTYPHDVNFVSTYTPSGTAAGSFQASTFTEQTVTMTPYVITGGTPAPAVKDETGGHFGFVPAALKTYVALQLNSNYFAEFPWGLYMDCNQWQIPGGGCSDFYTQSNTYFDSIIGRLVIGSDTGASTSIMNLYGNNSFTDIAELGTVGSFYVGNNPNSAEHGSSSYSTLGLCGVGLNYTTWIGMYATTNEGTTGYCLDGFNGEGAHQGGRGKMFIGPLVGVPPGSPIIENSTFVAPWFFANDDGNAVCLDGGNLFIMAFGTYSSDCHSASWALLPGGTAGYYEWRWLAILAPAINAVD